MSLPAVIGITTPGKSTVFFKGNIGSVLGTCSLFISSSSSGVKSGINSASSSIPEVDKLSISINFIRFISFFFTSFCHIYLFCWLLPLPPKYLFTLIFRVVISDSTTCVALYKTILMPRKCNILRILTSYL